MSEGCSDATAFVREEVLVEVVVVLKGGPKGFGFGGGAVKGFRGSPEGFGGGSGGCSGRHGWWGL